MTLSKRAMQTFQHQSSIPRLPIPPLENSLDHYLTSVKAIQENSTSIKKTESILQEFTPIGHKLHAMLVKYDKTQANSWLEKIWLDKAYNIWRVPIMINVNWWTSFQDPTHQKENTQINRAASLIHGLIQMNTMINKQQLPPEQTKTGQYMCMNQLKCIFQAYRTPFNPIDETLTHFPTISNYIVVLIKNQVYKVPIDSSFTIPQIKYLLEQISVNSDDLQPNVGILTAIDRSTWANEYQQLLKDPVSKDSLETIKNALFAVALDDKSHSTTIDKVYSIFHNYGQNRWFDIGLTIVVDKDGRAGCNGEHSPCDAVIPANMFDFILKNEKPAHMTSVPVHASIEHLKFNSTNSSLISTATKEAKETASQMTVELLHFDNFGANFIKSNGKCSPDAFIQLTLQLAYYLTHKQVDATYESASTRLFKHGRTETCRSASIEMKQFVQNFYNLPIEQQWPSSELPLQQHIKQLSRCSQGYGIDRLFLGLKEMALLNKDQLSTEEHESITKFFQDVNFTKSNTFILSTSNVSPGTFHYGGFGPVALNGYGVNYSIANDQLKFSISGWQSTTSTPAQLKSNINKVLMDFKAAITSK